MCATVLLAAFAGAAVAQGSLAPAPDTRKLFEFFARGVQVYVCKQKDEAFSWVFEAPEAVLYDAQGKEVGVHAKGPRWTLSDGSSTVGEVIGKEPSPKQGAIPWLLLKTTSHEGSGKLDRVRFIRRVDTDGGAEPAAGCDAAHEGEAARVPYTATYEFFGL